MSKIKVIAVVGPTASGKTKLAVELAKKYNGEIISADSMQIYKNMQIATAKPTEEEQCGIKHHLIDFVEPSKSYSVGDYVLDAEKSINEIVSKGKTPIICGGTGLYVDSLLKGLTFTENSVDEKLREELSDYNVDDLLAMLTEFDSLSAEKLSLEKNKKRIIRAIEFYKTTGTTISSQNEINSTIESKYDAMIFGITANDRQFIYDRINKRVDLMLEDGLLDETRNIINMDLSQTSKKAIGHKELIPYLNNEDNLESCIEKLKMETRRYAKRQLTWFRRNQSINWINIDEFNNYTDLVNCVVDIINKKGFING